MIPTGKHVRRLICEALACYYTILSLSDQKDKAQSVWKLGSQIGGEDLMVKRWLAERDFVLRLAAEAGKAILAETVKSADYAQQISKKIGLS